MQQAVGRDHAATGRCRGAAQVGEAAARLLHDHLGRRQVPELDLGLDGQVGGLSDAVLSYASLTSWEQHGLGEQFLTLARSCWRTRGFGDFWSHMLVAEGAADLAVEPEVELWDLAAPQVIVEEAGGRFTNLGDVPTPAGGSVVSTNGLLHDRVLTILRP